MRVLGIRLYDIRMLLELVDAGGGFCATKEITLRHLADIRGKIASRRKLELALKAIASSCQPVRQPNCPILDGKA